MSGPQNPLAFPVATASHIHSEGMTLRDWFAGQALATRAGYSTSFRAENIARVCYELADAMLAERDKETDQ